jgi:hypothetical protein
LRALPEVCLENENLRREKTHFCFLIHKPNESLMDKKRHT